MSRRRRFSGENAVEEGYARARRHVRPMPVHVDDQVIYEDGDGVVHDRSFRVIAVQGRSVTITGWPNGRKRRSRPVNCRVLRRSLVRATQVIEEAFKAMFGVPEDTPRTRYAVSYCLKKKTRKKR